MQDILLRPEYSDEQIRLRKEVIQKVESMQDEVYVKIFKYQYRQLSQNRKSS